MKIDKIKLDLAMANKAFSARERLKAAELIGKRYGIFKESYDVESHLPVIILNDLEE